MTWPNVLPREILHATRATPRRVYEFSTRVRVTICFESSGKVLRDLASIQRRGGLKCASFCVFVFMCFCTAGRHTTTLPCAPHGDDDTDDDDDDEDDERVVVVARDNLARDDRVARTAAATFQMARRGCLWWGWRAREGDGHGGVGSRA